MLGRDVLSLKDFERDECFTVFQAADELATFARRRRGTDLLRGKILVTAFYQASTRTRLSTEAAMQRLGGSVLGFADPTMTRAGDFYQESLRDTVRMLELYGDVIAMRHYRQGAPAEAAGYVDVPVINCGDGWGEHPTQVLADLYTVWRERGTLDGLRVVLVGDMRMRPMHSWLYAASRFDLDMIVVCPEEMGLLPELTAELAGLGVKVRELPTVADALPEADVIYMFPVVQPDYTKRWHEPPTEVGRTPAAYQVDRRLLESAAKQGAMVLHPLPRMDELSADVDGTVYQRYFAEAFNAVVVRMALLALTLGAMP